MAETFQVLLFGDETGGFGKPLRELCERHKGIVLNHFLDGVKDILHDEIRRLPSNARKEIPPFSDVLDLVNQDQDSVFRNQILKTPLTCIFQLGIIISFLEDHLSQQYVPTDAVVVGLCTGLLAAAAVSASRNVLDLAANALKIVRIAFRVGVEVNNAAQRLSTSHDFQVRRNWSRLVVGVPREASIDEVARYNERKAFPLASSIYVSSTNRNGVTISGPPANVEALFSESEYFRQHKTIPVDVFGPFHAPHLYREIDFEDIVQPITDSQASSVPLSNRVISGIEEAFMPNDNLDHLIREVVGAILIRTLSFDHLLPALVSATKDSGFGTCSISSVGPSSASSTLLSALKTETEVDVSIEDYLGLANSRDDLPLKPQKIAIVGMSGRFPDADNLESLWSLLEQGLDVHRKVPPDRFDVDRHYDPSGKRKNTSHTPYGCFIEEPGLFDPKFFNMSPREAYQTDPMGRLALVTAYEALEMSGFMPNRTPSSTLDRVGTFYGQTSDDWRQVNAAQNIDTYYIPGTIRAFASGRINYHFNFKGPSYNVDTACSSSFAAIQLACTSLLSRECDTAVAGGLNIMTTPDLFAGLSRAQFLSKTGSCKTFDDGADGFCRGDGVGTVILKRLESAISDNDPILGVVLGTATNHSSEAASITQPHAPTQEDLYRKILGNSGVDARDISYVEMHGTGTQAGDGAEMRSISNVFASRRPGRRPDNTLHLGAIKANIGHGEASAGVSSLIKVLLMMQRDFIPPHVGIKDTMNTTFPADLKERGIRIPFEGTSWSSSAGGKRRAYLNNFSAAGGNTGLLLEDAPDFKATSENDPRTTFVISVSAKTAWSLEKNIAGLLSYLEANPATPLPSLSYTTTARRVHQSYRVSYAVSNIMEAKKALKLAQNEIVKPLSPKPPKVTFVFTGQGAHYASLGKQLFESSRQFRSDIIEFDRLGRKQGFPSFLPLIDGTVAEATSFSPFMLQLGQTSIQMALARLWISWGILPAAVLGHSLGEYAALNVAGVLSVSDTLYLVGRRAELLEKHCAAGTHALLAIATSLDSCQVLGNDNPEVACINGPREVVISGSTGKLMTCKETLTAAGIKSVLLPCAYAFHSAQVLPILEPLKQVASSINFATPELPVISPLLQKVVTESNVLNPDYLARHARETVSFYGGIMAAKEQGLVDLNTIWVEIGPSPICSAFIKASLGAESITVPSLRKNEEPWKTTSNGLSLLHRKGYHVDWEEVHHEYELSHTVLLLPRYTFENKNYWLEYSNNWCLNKGEAIEAPTEKTTERQLSTHSVQKLITEEYGDKISLVAASDLSEPHLNDAMSGHLVNGTALCPAGLYADIALTIAGYLHRKINNNTDYVPMNVCQLEIVKPLIAKARGEVDHRLLRISATAESPLRSVKVTYEAMTRDGEVGELHASCKVEYGETSVWLADWSRLAYLFQSRIDVLAQGSDVGKFERLSSNQAYKAFSSLVTYSNRFQGMREVVINRKNLEATSLINFRAEETDGDFDANPYWIDNITHLSGLVLNGSDAADSRGRVYISDGWESLQIACPLSNRKTYRNHVKMHPGPKGTMFGDVYVFDGEEMVALVHNVKFQGIYRSLLDKLLPPTNSASLHTKVQPLPLDNGPASQSQTSLHLGQKSTPNSVKGVDTLASSMPPNQENKDPMITEFVGIIAEELGLEQPDISSETVFTDIGLDSLMSLTISGRVREELEVEVPSSFFVDNATLGEAKSSISALCGDNSSSNGLIETASIDSASIESASDDSAVTTDATSTSGGGGDISFGDGTAKRSLESTTESIWRTISEELGITPSEVSDTGNFADMGVDSLMSLTITGRIREELGLDMPTSFFSDHPTVSQASAAVSALMGIGSTGEISPLSPTGTASPIDSDTLPSIPKPSQKNLENFGKEVRASTDKPHEATSTILSGSPKAASKALFLLPDGSGSATSYSALPSLSPDVCVYGLSCPFLRTPKDYTNGIDGVSNQYLSEIRKRQPQGPYFLGGWSAGGVLAYQIAYKLLEMGEKVDRLFLIDSPSPLNLEPLPSSLLHFVESLGMLGSQKSSPDWLIPHFEASIANLAAYEPPTMTSSAAPKTLIIWARDGLYKDNTNQRFPRSDTESKSVKFFLDDRLDSGSDDWGELLGEENIIAMPVQGNHFTAMREPVVQQVASLLRHGLGVR